MIPHPPHLINQHRRIPQTPQTRARALIKPHVRPDGILPTRLSQGADLGPVDEEALGGEAVEESVVFYGRGEGGPEWVAGQVGFGEDDEVGFILGGFADEGGGFAEGGGEVEVDGGDVAGCVW